MTFAAALTGGSGVAVYAAATPGGTQLSGCSNGGSSCSGTYSVTGGTAYWVRMATASTTASGTLTVTSPA